MCEFYKRSYQSDLSSIFMSVTEVYLILTWVLPNVSMEMKKNDLIEREASEKNKMLH